MGLYPQRYVLYLLSSCPWLNTSGSGSTGSGSSGAYRWHSPCCRDRCRSGLCALSAWRSLYSPHSCRHRSVYLEDVGRTRRKQKGWQHISRLTFKKNLWQFCNNSEEKHRKWVVYWRCLVTGGSVSTDGTQAFLGKHRPWAVGRKLLQAQRRFHIVGAAHCMEPRHGHCWVDLKEQQRRGVNTTTTRFSFRWISWFPFYSCKNIKKINLVNKTTKDTRSQWESSL